MHKPVKTQVGGRPSCDVRAWQHPSKGDRDEILVGAWPKVEWRTVLREPPVTRRPCKDRLAYCRSAFPRRTSAALLRSLRVSERLAYGKHELENENALVVEPNAHADVLVAT